MSELPWQKSTFSEGAGNNCVNVASSPDRPHTLHLRESDTPEVVLTTTPHALAALLRSARAMA
ncbi:DUF397 domain-containing protein [Streptomyces sp. NPDC021093]|uniref:DUF397 domain-containing protein n=1 Tax=Streptomyces sp. NPDC021093 TaxID=3365112 RepID=UPI0037BAAB57